MVGDQGQAEAILLSLERNYEGFHMVGDWG